MKEVIALQFISSQFFTEELVNVNSFVAEFEVLILQL